MVAPTSSISGALLLRTLGQAEVFRDGQAVQWPARSAEELLWYLHAHPAGKYRHDILAELWQLEDDKNSANRFRVALHRLRSTLARPDAVLEQGGRFYLHPDLFAASDTQALHQALEAARRSDHPRDSEELLRQALSAHEGDYLPHVHGDWVEEARRTHRLAVVEGYLTLSRLHCAARECHRSAQMLSRAVQQDPLISEDHHQRLMTCLAVTQDHYAAIEHYRRYRHYLKHELDDTPMPETVALAERIKAGERPCIHLNQQGDDC